MLISDNLPIDLFGKALTPAEKRLVELFVTTGNRNKELGFSLGVSVRTIKNQLTVIYAKLGVRNRSEMILKVGGVK